MRNSRSFPKVYINSAQRIILWKQIMIIVDKKINKIMLTMCKGKWDSYEDRFVLCCINYSRAGHDIWTTPQPEIEKVLLRDKPRCKKFGHTHTNAYFLEDKLV